MAGEGLGDIGKEAHSSGTEMVEGEMGFFFLAAVVTWLGARLLAGLRPIRSGTTPWWPAIVTGALYLAVVTAIAGHAGWHAVRDTGAGPMLGLLQTFAALDTPDLSASLGGVLAGMLLFEGFRRTPALPASHDAALDAYRDAWALLRETRTATHAVLAAAVFLAVALLSNPAILDRLKSVDAVGLKVELEAGRGRSAAPDAGNRQQISPKSDGSDGSLRYLGTLADIIREPGGMIDRDRAYARKFGTPIETESPLDILLQRQKALLGPLQHAIPCVNAYVAASADRSFFAIRGIEIALRIGTLEQSLRALGPPTAAAAGPEEARSLTALAQVIKRIAREMHTYLEAAQGEHHECDEAQALSFEGITLPRSAMAMAPYLTIAAASVAGGFHAPEVAFRDLTDWYDAYDQAVAAGTVQDVPWFRLRVLITLANLMWLSETQAIEPPRARLVLERIEAGFRALNLPPLGHFTADQAGACGGHDDLDRQLFFVRLVLLNRLLNAKVDAPEPQRPLTGRDQERARALRTADLRCLPKGNEDSAEAWRGAFTVTFGRIALAWAEQGKRSGQIAGAEARALQAEGAAAILEGSGRLDVAEADWREERARRGSKLTAEMMEPFEFIHDVLRARQAKADLQRQKGPE